MKIGAIIQARFSSSRLPGKVLKDLPCGSGIAVLSHVIRRLKKSKEIAGITVATTTNKDAAAIAEIARREKVACFRGSEDDVLSRYYLSAKKDALDIIVRVSSDCPCIDPAVVDSIINTHIRKSADYTSNTVRRSYPHGMDAEAVSFEALEKAYKRAKKDYEREHVTPYFYMNPGRFRIVHVKAPKGLRAPDIRITLDTEDDYVLLSAVFDYLYPKNKCFTAYDIVKLFEKKPWLKLLNKKTLQKRPSYALKDELREAVRLLELQQLNRAAGYLKRARHK